MGVCVVCQVGLVSDAVVVAVAILTTTITCTFQPLWSGKDFGRLHWYTLPIGELDGGGDSSWYHPVALESQSNGPPMFHLGDAG